MTTVQAIPAATLVLLRDREAGPPELLMIERAAAMAFAAGALVFPGGRVDPGDRALSPGAADRDEAAARVAAIRETIEEVGVAIGLVPPPDAGTLSILRAGLASGAPFAGLLEAAGLALDLAALQPFARWRPRDSGRRVYDTRFYLACSPAGAVAAPDGGECVRALWTTAAAALADADAGRHHIIFPTRRNLERLALASTGDDALADAARRTVATVTPWIERRGDADWLCIRDDQGYPVTAQPMATVLRG